MLDLVKIDINIQACKKIIDVCLYDEQTKNFIFIQTIFSNVIEFITLKLTLKLTFPDSLLLPIFRVSESTFNNAANANNSCFFRNALFVMLFIGYY